MNVVKFPLTPASVVQRGWHSGELQRLLTACEAHLPSGRASGWEFGTTECGDPQLYLVGPAPDYDCVLSISRLGSVYVLEDGQGHVVFEHDNIFLLADQIADAFSNKKRAFLAQLAIGWCAMREFYEEKVEPALAEPIELISHLAPSMSALA